MAEFNTIILTEEDFPPSEVAIKNLPHPGKVIPGSTRHVLENPPDPDPKHFPYQHTDAEHKAIAAELEARKNLPETHPDLIK